MKNTGIRKPFNVGQKYGVMTCVSGPFGVRHPYSYVFDCECGSVGVEKTTAQIMRARNLSCGCTRKAARGRVGERSRTHGMTALDSPVEMKRLHGVHWQMQQRCYNPDCSDYKLWGARGISVCQEWLGRPLDFAEWALESGYRLGLTIERVDVNGNYEPSNCTWVPNKDQARNTRKIHWLSQGGKRMSIADWSRETGIPYRTIMSRLRYGWETGRVLSK